MHSLFVWSWTIFFQLKSIQLWNYQMIMIASRLKCKVSWDQPHFWWLIIITRKIGNDTLETFLHNLGLLIKPGGITSKSNALSFQCSEVFSWKKPRSRVSPLCWVTLVETRNEVPEGVEICKTLSCKNWPLANQAFCAQINGFLFFFFLLYDLLPFRPTQHCIFPLFLMLSSF